MASDPVMINDPQVLAVEIRDNGEPLVDVRKMGLRTAPDHPRATSPAETRFWCRSSVADRLVIADAALDPFDLVVTEAHRPIELQTLYWETDLEAVKAARPDLDEGSAIGETAKYVAPPWIVPPHTTGGAVDVILVDNHRELAMGSELNEQCDEMRTDHQPLAAEHRHHRALLVDAMQSAGFVNYGHEWWHYSYGDRYWAFAHDEIAVYGAL